CTTTSRRAAEPVTSSRWCASGPPLPRSRRACRPTSSPPPCSGAAPAAKAATPTGGCPRCGRSPAGTRKVPPPPPPPPRR
ncbi:MAG: hypothetical protein AVDCRST_MAG07-2188, partial [uncultured Frankineae bacterium]